MKQRPWVHTPTDSGFTLVELLIALGLGSVVLGIMVAFFMNLTRSSIAQNAAASAQHSARAGVEHIVNDLRMAGLDPLKTAAPGSKKSRPRAPSCASPRTAAISPSIRLAATNRHRMVMSTTSPKR